MKALLQKFDKTFYLTLLVVLVFVLVIFISQSSWINSFKKYNASKIEVGSEAPTFILKTSDEEEISLEDKISNNRVTILFFLESYCGACQRQMPDLVSIYKEYKDREVEIYGIDIIKEEKSTIDNFIKKYEVNFPILIDEKSKVSNVYGVKKTPAVFFISKDGIIRDKFEERNEEEEIREIIDKILEGNQ